MCLRCCPQQSTVAFPTRGTRRLNPPNVRLRGTNGQTLSGTSVRGGAFAAGALQLLPQASVPRRVLREERARVAAAQREHAAWAHEGARVVFKNTRPEL